MSAGKIAAIIVGALIGLTGIGLLIGSAGLLWANETQRDPDGFFTTDDFELSTESFALTSAEIDLGADPSDWFPSGLATVRLEATPPGGGEVFIGIGPEEAVDSYLENVARSEVRTVTGDDASYRNIDGDQSPAVPTDQGLWTVSAAGPGTQTIEWELESGRWALVVMNADASPGVTVDAAAGADTDLLVPIALGLLGTGLIMLIVSIVLIVAGVRKTGEPTTAPLAESGGFGTYPVLLEGDIDPNLSRWQWLVKWFLAIPHYIVLAFLWIAFVMLSIVAWFAIVFTGRYPRGIFDFNVGVLRWSWRVSYYALGVLATDQYPPFTLADADYPARLDVAYPENLSRGLALVKSWLLAIPHYVIVGLFTSGLVWYTTEMDAAGNEVAQAGAGLISILVFIAVVILLFTGRYPQGLFDLVMGLQRWVYRVAAYAALMRDEYPPFRLDTGGREPGRSSPSGSPGGEGPDSKQLEPTDSADL
jgi:hypothetical protein